MKSLIAVVLLALPPGAEEIAWHYDADTALKVNISWHFFFPGCSTTPWQLEGVIRALKQDGYSPDLIHACHNRTVVIDAHLGERENKQLTVVEAHGLRNIHIYETEEWINSLSTAFVNFS